MKSHQMNPNCCRCSGMAGAHFDASKFHVPGVCAIARDVALECVHRTNPDLISFYAGI